MIKMTAFGFLFADYCLSNAALKKSSPVTGNALVGYSIHESILKCYEMLEIDSFKEVIKILQGVYFAA